MYCTVLYLGSSTLPLVTGICRNPIVREASEVTRATRRLAIGHLASSFNGHPGLAIGATKKEGGWV